MPKTNPTGGSVAVVKIGANLFPGMDWTLDSDAKLKDVSNFQDGRRQKVTMPDADFKMTVLWDADNMPHDPAGFGLKPGVEVTVLAYTDATRYFSVPVVVGKMSFKSKVEDVLTYDFDGKLNGDITWPVI